MRPQSCRKTASLHAEPAAAVPGEADPPDVADIERAMIGSGLRISLLRRGSRAYSGGLAVVLDAAGAGWELVIDDISRALDAGVPLGVHLRAGCFSGTGAVLDVLADLVASSRFPRTPVTISVEGATSGQRCNAPDLAALSPGRARFVFIDRGKGAAFPAHRLGASGWLPALHAGVRSRCPLLSAEPTTTLLPNGGLAVPSHSAWLPVTVDLLQFTGSNGRFHESHFLAALDQAVTLGDTLLDHLSWCGPLQAEDARLNRRLAIVLAGIGDYVLACGEDPASLACQRRLDRLVAGAHDRVWERSASLAATRGVLPQLTEKQPSARWRDDAHRADWTRRWQDAVARVQVRHRNLLCLSPFSLLPGNGHYTPGWDALLPLLAHADVVGFAPAAGRAHRAWTAPERFHDALRRQIERFNSTSLISAGV